MSIFDVIYNLLPTFYSLLEKAVSIFSAKVPTWIVSIIQYVFKAVIKIFEFAKIDVDLSGIALIVNQLNDMPFAFFIVAFCLLYGLYLTFIFFIIDIIDRIIPV